MTLFANRQDAGQQLAQKLLAYAHKIVVAVPVSPPPSIYGDLYGMADEIICLTIPELFYAVGQAYINFSQTTDEEVQKILEKFVTKKK